MVSDLVSRTTHTTTTTIRQHHPTPGETVRRTHSYHRHSSQQLPPPTTTRPTPHYATTRTTPNPHQSAALKHQLNLLSLRYQANYRQIVYYHSIPRVARRVLFPYHATTQQLKSQSKKHLQRTTHPQTNFRLQRLPKDVPTPASLPTPKPQPEDHKKPLPLTNTSNTLVYGKLISSPNRSPKHPTPLPCKAQHQPQQAHN